MRQLRPDEIFVLRGAQARITSAAEAKIFALRTWLARVLLLTKEKRRPEDEALRRRFLRAMAAYLEQVAGLLVVGSIAGIVMNTAVVLPAILIGRAIDVATSWGQATSGDVWWAALAFVGGVTPRHRIRPKASSGVSCLRGKTEVTNKRACQKVRTGPPFSAASDSEPR